jgi:hypothetical protein
MEPRSGRILQEYWAFVRANQRWWWASVAVVLILLAALVLLGRTDAAPFIYMLD